MQATVIGGKTTLRDNERMIASSYFLGFKKREGKKNEGREEFNLPKKFF